DPASQASLRRGSAFRTLSRVVITPEGPAPGNDLETGGGNQWQIDAGSSGQNGGISRESATNGNQSQSPNSPYKQDVAGSSPAPPITSGRSHRFASVALNVSSYTRI